MPAILFLSVDAVLQIHNRVVEEFGGDPGIRDYGFLGSAVSMPQSTFAGEFLHSEIAEMAAAYHYHLCANHPFLDGNKRVAVAVSEIFLLLNGNELIASDNELEELTLGVARGQISKEEAIAFFKRHIHET